MMTIRVGQRVLAKVGRYFYFGILTNQTGQNTFHVEFDDDDDAEVHIDDIIPTAQYAFDDEAELTKKQALAKQCEPSDLIQEVIWSTYRVRKLPESIPYCMWFYFNHYLFRAQGEDLQTYPQFLVKNKRSDAIAMFHWKVYLPYEYENMDIELNLQSNICYKIMANSMVHEMVHQNQFMKAREADPTGKISIGHGESFKRWNQPAQDLVGFAITQYTNDNDHAEVLAATILQDDKKIAKDPRHIVVRFDGQKFTAIICKDLKTSMAYMRAYRKMGQKNVSMAVYKEKFKIDANALHLKAHRANSKKFTMWCNSQSLLDTLREYCTVTRQQGNAYNWK